MARARNPGVTIEAIEAYKNKIHPKTGKPYNQNQIAEELGVSKQRISQVKLASRRYSMTARERVLRNYPWKTGERFHEASPNRRMRDHAEYMATNGKGMSRVKLQRLLWFYRFLESNNVVVEFDPTIPPEPGVSSVGGFAYRPRRESDHGLIIRVNEYTTLTDEGEDLWRFPEEWPKIRQ